MTEAVGNKKSNPRRWSCPGSVDTSQGENAMNGSPMVRTIKGRGRKRKRRYSAEFREKAVKLARRGDRPMKAVAEALDVHPQTLYTWVYKYEGEHGSIAAEDETPEQELKRLRKENERLKV